VLQLPQRHGLDLADGCWAIAAVTNRTKIDAMDAIARIKDILPSLVRKSIII